MTTTRESCDRSVIQYHYDPAGLAGISATEFEAELYDALRGRFGNVHIDIAHGSEKKWGFDRAGDEIGADTLREIGNDVFRRLCEAE